MSGRRNSLQGKKGDDPEWVKEIVSRPITSKEQEITDKYKKLFRDLYLDYLRDGLKPKDAKKIAKNIVLSFKNQNYR